MEAEYAFDKKSEIPQEALYGQVEEACLNVLFGGRRELLRRHGKRSENSVSRLE